jgi:eukaryotic-like serine/threonine-protein kinase
VTAPVEAPAPLERGASLTPKYRVIAHLARGKALDVYDVWSEERHALCVAKVVRPDRQRDAGARRRLRREGRNLLALSHPHIVRAYELVERPHPVLVLEALTGATLGYILDTRTRRMPVEDLVYLGLQLCSAVRYMHRRGVLHLDLKPDNIVSQDGLAKVIDLSVARPPGRARPGIGTRQYLSPEQARGGDLGAAADVWGIGAVLYAAATGRRPFYPLDKDVQYPQLTERAAPVTTHRRLPKPFAELVDACLEPAADDRPAPAEVFDRLEEFAAPPA